MKKELNGVNFHSIRHFSGSKMTDSADSRVDPQVEFTMTRKLLKPSDRIVITEKLDGMNVGVQKLSAEGELSCVSIKGYAVETSPYICLAEFKRYVMENAELFRNLLSTGERIVCEWLVKTISVKYNLPHAPIAALCIYGSDGKRLTYNEFSHRVAGLLPTPALIHMGVPMPVDMAMSLLGEGYHGSIDKPEGVVYTYERGDSVVTTAKMVRQDHEAGKQMDSFVFNKWKGDFKLALRSYGVETAEDFMRVTEERKSLMLNM